MHVERTQLSISPSLSKPSPSPVEDEKLPQILKIFEQQKLISSKLCKMNYKILY